MKKIIFLSIIASLFATAVVAQDQKGANVLVPGEPIPIDGPGGGGGVTNYYINATGTITKSGYTYKYRNLKLTGVELSSHVELYNATNSYLDMEWGYKDGTQATFEELMGQVISSEYISDSSQTIEQTLTMVNGLFSTQQKNMLKGKSMSITVRFDSSTGRIADVYFDFFRDSPFVNIPVETYRSIELALKQNLTVTMTPKGKRLRYKQLYWSQKF